eukprot:IDg13094t1
MLGFAATVAVPHVRAQHRTCRRRPARVRATAAPHAPAASDNAPLEDRDVPVAHRGLHDALYGDGDSAAVHGEGSRAGVEEPRVAFHSDGETNFAVDELLARLMGTRTAGVYRVVDKHGAASYVGLSRDVALSVRAHRMYHGADLVASAHVRTFAFPSRARLERVRDEWLAALLETPVGNAANWDGAAAASAAAMTAEQRESFEASKRKIRQAMADPALYDEDVLAQRDPDALRAAVENDDWSAEVDRQTAATTTKKSTAAAAAPAPMVSPFAQGTISPDESGAANGASSLRAMTEANVEHVLDDVRPLLQADGGDVNLVGIANGEITLRLVGACGTCSAAATTLRMGIERALRAAFGDTLVAVHEVGGADGGKAPLSIASVDAVLDAEVRGAIGMLGGDVRVMAADAADGLVSLRYKGPDQLAYGIELVVREKVPGLSNCSWLLLRLIDRGNGDERALACRRFLRAAASCAHGVADLHSDPVCVAPRPTSPSDLPPQTHQHVHLHNFTQTHHVAPGRGADPR